MPLRVGQVLGRSLRVWARHLLPFVALQALLLSPVVLLDELAPPSPLVRWVVVVVLGSLASAALTHAVIEDRAGRVAPMAAGIRVAWARLGALLRLALVLAAVFGVAFFVCFAFARLVGGQLARVAPGLADVAALVALFVPLTALFARLYVAAPAVVVEDVGALEAVRRSLLLSRGQAGRVFAVLVVLIGGLLAIAALVPPGWLPRLFGVLAASLLSTACAVTYADLRASREGLSSDDLAAVFD